jgi:hypothetical protein
MVARYDPTFAARRYVINQPCERDIAQQIVVK